MKEAFVLPEDTAILVFAEPSPFAGAEVKVRVDVPIGLFIGIRDLINDEKGYDVWEAFAEAVLIEWNIADRNGPIPATSEGRGRATIRFCEAVVSEWMEVAVSPPDPLVVPSPNGSTLGARTTKKETRSANRGH